VKCGEEGVHVEHEESVPFPSGSVSKPTLERGHLPLKSRTDNSHQTFNGGGGILNRGTLEISNAVVEDSEALDDPGGGIYNAGGALTIKDSVVRKNVAEDGGGIFSLGGALTIDRSTVMDNRAQVGAGGGSGAGGGINNNSGSVLVINESSINENSARSGGGILNAFSKMTLDQSAIYDNAADTNGGGILSTNPSVENDPNPAASTTIKNSTLSRNFAGSLGGGVYNNEGLVVIEYTTITGNGFVDGGGNNAGAGVAGDGDVRTRTEVRASIIAANGGPDVSYTNGDINTFVSGGYSIIGDGNAVDGNTFQQPGDRPGTADPGLGFLADNGGPTLTHALEAGSPALDNVLTEACDVQTDQRGVARPQGPACDSGSYEKRPPAVQITKGPASQTVASGGTASFTITLENTGDTDLSDIEVTDPNAPDCERSEPGPLTPNAKISYECEVADVTEGFTNVAEVDAQAAEGGVRVADTSGKAVVEVRDVPPASKVNLSLTKKASKGRPTVGQKLTYTLRVKNNGPDRATGVKVVDTLPKGVKVLSTSKGCKKLTARKVRCNISRLGDGRSVAKKIVVKVNRAGKLVNKARASSSVRDPNPKNNSARAVVRAKPKAKAAPRFKQISCRVKDPTVRLVQGKQVVVADSKPGKGIACVVQGNQLALAKALKNQQLGLVKQGGKQVRAAKGKVVKSGARRVVVRVPRGF
ncbi:MAG: choice-of-anchor Q domain-containing protein, partial [Rubrobacteraceae bacterium]